MMASNAKFVQFGLRKPCPTGTVPIPRVTKEDLRRARTMPRISSIQAEGLKDASTGQHVLSLSLSLSLVMVAGCIAFT